MTGVGCIPTHYGIVLVEHVPNDCTRRRDVDETKIVSPIIHEMRREIVGHVPNHTRDDTRDERLWDMSPIIHETRREIVGHIPNHTRDERLWDVSPIIHEMRREIGDNETRDCGTCPRSYTRRGETRDCGTCPQFFTRRMVMGHVPIANENVKRTNGRCGQYDHPTEP